MQREFSKKNKERNGMIKGWDCVFINSLESGRKEEEETEEEERL